MSSFTMTVGNAEIVALSDMNCVFPTPLVEMWPNVTLSSWEPYRDRYPERHDRPHSNVTAAVHVHYLSVS